MCIESKLSILFAVFFAVCMVRDRLNDLDDGICYVSCESCGCDVNIDVAGVDCGGNYFCPPCWTDLAPAMRAEYEDLVKRGEIEGDT